MNAFRTLFTVSLLSLALQRPAGAIAQHKQGMMLATLNDAATINQDVRNLHLLGADLVRFPVYFSYIPSTEAWLNKADAVLAQCEALNMLLVIDIHHPTPGLFNADIVNVGDFVNKWRLFATRFKNRGKLWYDLCNEPSHPQWRTVATLAAQAIRAIDTEHKIVFAPRGVTTAPADSITPLPGISNQVLEFHFYDWPDVQFSPYSPTGAANVTPYPSVNRTADDLNRLLDRVQAAGIRTGLPVFIGEVAISRQHPNAPRFLRDFTAKCEARGIHLAVHAPREADIWNYELNPSAWAQIGAWLAH